MSAESAVLAGRAAIESLMIDRCRITREAKPTDPGYVAPELDEDTGEYPEPPRVMLYEGICRVQVRSDINSNAVDAVIGEHEFVYRTATLQLPIASGHIPVNCVAEILDSPLDPTLVGAEYLIHAETKGKTHATHRRFRIKEVLD